MKKILTLLLLLLGVSAVALAVPAYPGKYKYTQPDGSVLVLQNHGDEYFHWTTDESGRVVEMDADGFYRPVAPAAHQARLVQASRASIGRRGRWSSYDNPPSTNFGDRRILCILAQFADITFTIEDPGAKFNAMLNESGYSYDGSIGSVRDYYIDNSNGQYRPEFDVFGPVTLANNSEYYYNRGSYNKVSEAIMEAYEQLKEQIQIDDYDTDGDGDIDMVLFYFAGYNQAEGAPANTIWPHQSTGDFGTLGGKTFNRYFCTSELRGNSGEDMCAIGTTCHEFAHSLGLPDFYDTDYETNGYNDNPTAAYDLMCYGNYNDSGRRPPYLSAVERNMLGWMPEPATLTGGEYVLAPVRNDVAYRSDAATEGEYYILEVRDNYKWDSSIGDYGLLVYHIDKTSRIVTGTTSAAELWETTNRINAYGGHPCFRLITPGSGYAFPGIGPVTSFPLLDWDGNANGVILSGISFDGSKVAFQATVTDKRVMYGTVTNTSGFPVAGARVVLTQSAYGFAAPALLSGDRYVETDASGFYEFILPDSATENQILTVSKDGFIPVAMNLPVESGFLNQDFTLTRVGEGQHGALYKYDPSLTFYRTRVGQEQRAFGVRYTADELEAAGVVGSLLQTILFQSCAITYDKVYVIVEIDGERVLLRDVTARYVPNSMSKVDISDAGIKIPEGKSVLIAYGMTGMDTTEFNLNMYGPQEEDNEGNLSVKDFLNSSEWKRVTFGGGLIFNFPISADISAPDVVTLSQLGVASVRVVEDVPTVVAPAGKTVHVTQWYLDGTPVAEVPVLSSLSAGDHTYMVRLEYYDGTVERVYYDVHK